MSAPVAALARKVFEEYSRAGGNPPDAHFDRNAAEQWMAHALEFAGVAELIEAMEGLDEAYCRAGPQLTRDERMEDRKRLIAARAALTLVKGGAA